MGLRECLVDLRPSLGVLLLGITPRIFPGFPNPARHPFIQLIDQLAAKNFDIIFCAGNCGGVCPDGRCGPNDFGPGRGIWGANAHPSVLTVGAVRTDTNWIGYSSEGPGPGRPPFNKLANQKPDLCAPSHYIEPGGDIPPEPRHVGGGGPCRGRGYRPPKQEHLVTGRGTAYESDQRAERNRAEDQRAALEPQDRQRNPGPVWRRSSLAVSAERCSLRPETRRCAPRRT